MASALLSRILLLALVFCSAESPVSVQQTPAVTGSKGGSVTLNCTIQEPEIPCFTSQWDFYRKGVHIASWTGSYDTQPLLTAQPKEKAFVQQEDHTSTLVITDLQFSDAGTYVCTVRIFRPPPRTEVTGNSTVLRVNTPPRIWLSLSPADEPTMVTCTVTEFYPASIDVTLRSTCGGCWELEDNSSIIENPDGTYYTKRSALLTMVGCRDRKEVTCVVKHEMGQWTKDLRIPDAEALRLSSGFLIRIVGLAAFVVIVCGIFLGYHVCSQNTKVQL